MDLSTTNLIKSNMYGVAGPPYQPTKERAIALNGMLYFTFDDGVNGDELWQSDGTASGTKMITDIGPGSQTSWIDFLIPVNAGLNSRLYFTSTKKTGLLYIKTDAVTTTINETGTQAYTFEVFPNPARGILNIVCKSESYRNLNDEPLDIKIINALGQILFNQKINSQHSFISTQHLPRGVYFVNLGSNDIKITKKIIIE
jgi:ELWxxDGT repeat protein